MSNVPKLSNMKRANPYKLYEKEKRSWKDTLVYIIFLFVMIVPPWNIFCWTIGSIYYFFFRKNRHLGGDDYRFMMYVTLAPVLIIFIPYEWVCDKIEKRRTKKGRLT